MKHVSVIKPNRNLEALAAGLAAQFGGLFQGIAIGFTGDDDVVTVNLADEATSQQVNQARSIIENHDPAVLTPRQQEEQERQQKLAAMRESYRDVEVDPADYSGEKSVIQALAQKLAWLEQEVVDLRGGQV